LDQIKTQAKLLMQEVLRFRRMVNNEPCEAHSDCNCCASPHLEKVQRAVLKNEQVVFVLTAFPGKSPNRAKVLGSHPDMAEKQALKFLNSLCIKIQKIYKPGAKVVICSDGRVFSDVVGMPESDVTSYQDQIDTMIADLGLQNIETFNLDQLYPQQDFDTVREDLMARHGQSLEELKAKVRRGGKGSHVAEDQDAHRMYCGITRFLFEDSMTPGQTQSKTQLQKSAKRRAYEVIRRSNAWSGILAVEFPHAVRLSIHPQVCGSEKLGIQLLGRQTWLTPWHGVAVRQNDQFVLMKKWEAEKLEAKLVYDDKGCASHYEVGV
ncbi:MAG: isocyanide synthase family protein, partial [Pseudomonadota bacterium]